MTEPEVLRRVRVNWQGAARRLGRARATATPLPASHVILFVATGLALVVLVGLLYDARAIAWTHTLPSAVRAVFHWITRFGTSGWLLIPSGVVVIVVSLGDWRRVGRASAAAWWEIATFAAVLFAVVAISGLATDLIKPIVGRSRPEYVLGGPFAFTPLSLGGYAHYSFPSGHSTTAAAVAMLAAFVPSVITIPVVVAAALVAFSRIVVDAHFPSDVVGGIFMGIGVGYLILRWMLAAGLVFVDRRNGHIQSRFGVLRRLGRRHGLSTLFPALWIALGPSPQPPDDTASNAASRSATRSPGSSSPM
jgi:undecaprenyl-diphosphatase